MKRWTNARRCGWRVVVGLSVLAVAMRVWGVGPARADEQHPRAEAEERRAPDAHAEGKEGIRLSEEAKRNIGLTVEEAAPRTIQKVITVNGLVKPQPTRLAAVGPKTDAI